MSSDGVPLLWHDWSVIEGIMVPSLTAEEVRNLTNTHDPRVMAAPLATLTEVFAQTPPSLGFNVEVKYPLPDEVEDELGGQDFPPLAEYLRAILTAIPVDTAGRLLYFSSFHPEACLWLREHSSHPILFLTSAGGWKSRHDFRCNSLEAAIEFAKEANLHGLVSECTPLIEDPTWIKRIQGDGLILFSWGKGNNDPAKVRAQMGIDGIICDDVALITRTLNDRP